MNAFEILAKYKEEFLIGISVTLQIALIVWLIGLVAGGVLGVVGWGVKNVEIICYLFVPFLYLCGKIFDYD